MVSAFTGTETEFENLRGLINDELNGLSDRELAEALAERNIDADAVEGFFDDVGKFAAKAAPVVLPAAGKVIGGIYGGPAGAALGGQLGSLAGGAIASATGQKPAASPSPAAITHGPAARAEPTSVPKSPGSGSPAAAQLFQALTRPEVLQAIASMALGSLGKANVDVGGTSVPVTAFSNMVESLAARAGAEYGESVALGRVAAQAVPEYMMDATGEARGDPAVEGERADALYELLSEQTGEGESADPESAGEWQGDGEMEYAESEADAVELLELAYELTEAESD